MPWLVFEFFGGPSDFKVKQNIFFPVIANITPIAAVVRLICVAPDRPVLLLDRPVLLPDDLENYEWKYIVSPGRPGIPANVPSWSQAD